MHPDLLSIGPFSLHTYGLLMALGFAAGLINWVWLGKREGYSPSVCADLMFWIILSGVGGARLAYILENIGDYGWNIVAWLRIDQGGLVFYGGFVAAGIMLVVYSRLKHLRLTRLLDFVVTAVPLAHALGRVGCFLNGCCYGALCSNTTIAVRFPRLSLPWYAHLHQKLITSDALQSLPVYPVQLFEAAYNVLIYLVLITVYRRRKRVGIVTALYLTLYAVGRFSLEFFRGDKLDRTGLGMLSVGQIVSIPLFVFGLAYFLVLKAKLAGEEVDA